METSKRGIRKRLIYEVYPTPQFIKDVKYYKKKKKFKHVDDDIDAVVKEIENGNLIGDEISGIGLPFNEDIYKLRIANSDTKSGKSNGYRLIYYVIKNDKEVYLLSLYYKKDTNSILTKTQITELIKEIFT